MDIHNLIRMANRIGDFFEAMPDENEALDGIANHIQKFWEPRMRREILTCVDQGQDGDLKDIVRRALVRHRAALMPA